MQLLLQNKPQEVIKIVSPLGGLFCNDDPLTVHYQLFFTYIILKLLPKKQKQKKTSL